MKVDLNTVVKCCDYSFGTTETKDMPIVEFLQYLKNLEKYYEPYVQNSDTIDKWLEQGYIDTDELGDENVRLSRKEKNLIEIWYEYFYDDGCGGDVGSACSYIILPQEYDIPIPDDSRHITLDTKVSNIDISPDEDSCSCFHIRQSDHTLGEWLNKLLNEDRFDTKLDEEEKKKIKTILENGECATVHNTYALNVLPIFYTNHYGNLRCIHFIPNDEVEKFNERAVNRIPTKSEWDWDFLPF